MKFSAKGEYGILAIFELAQHIGEAPLQAKAISKNQHIPLRFLEQVLNDLRKAGLVDSTRGALGGYVLGRSPSEIRLIDIIEALEGPINPSGKNSGNDDRPPFSGLGPGEEILSPVWEDVRAAVAKILESITVQDLCERKKERDQQRVLMYHI